MKKFLKISTGASGATNEGVIFAASDIEQVNLDTTNDAIDIKGYSGTDYSLSTVANKEAEGAAELMAEIAHGKEVVIDVLNFSDNVRGPELAAITLTNTAIAASADLQFTPASATVGVNFTATITQDSDTDVKVVTSGTFTTAALPVIVFENTDPVTLSAGDHTVTVEMFYPNRPDEAAKVITHAVTLT